MFNKNFITPSLVILTLVSLSSLLQAASGSIIGTIRDAATLEPIPGAVVAVIGSELGANADLEGRFQIKGLSPGYYNIRIQMMSYKTVLKNRVMVRSNAPTVLEVELEPSPIQMKGVIVRPSFFEKAKDAPASSQRLDFEEIIAQPGGSWDVQRAVQALPAVVSGTDQNNEIIVRGGLYGENLFLLDNIEIPNPNHFAWQGTGGGPVTMINTDFVRQADFYAGAFPARYGDKASSVLDIKYRQGLSDRLYAKGDVGTAGAGLALEGPIGRGNFMVSGHRSFLGLIAKGFGMTAVPHYYDLQGKAVCHLTPKLKLSFTGIYGNDWIDIQPGGDMDQDVNEVVQAKSHQYAGGLNLNYLKAGGYLNLTLSRTKNYWDQYVTDTTGAEFWENRSTEIESGAKLDLRQQMMGGEVSAGLSLKRPECYFFQWMKPDTIYLYYPGTDSVIAQTGVINRYEISDQLKTWKYAAHIQYKREWGKILTGHAGLRFDAHGLTKKTYLSPRLGLSLHLGPNHNLNLAAGRCYQSPEWSQLAMDSANHGLGDKYTDQVVLGLERFFSDDLRGTVEIYYKEYKDVPLPYSMTTPDPNDLSSRYVNQGTGYARGLELFLQKKVKANFWGTASYSYSLAMAEDPRDPSVEFPWDFDYRHVLTLIAGYRKDLREIPWYGRIRSQLWYRMASWLPLLPGDETELSGKWRYLGGRPYTPQTYHPEWRRWTLDPNQPINSARMRPYHRFDLHLQRRWFFGHFNLISYFDLQNVFNSKNEWTYLYHVDGTHDVVYQFSRMLVGGVMVEF